MEMDTELDLESKINKILDFQSYVYKDNYSSTELSKKIKITKSHLLTYGKKIKEIIPFEKLFINEIFDNLTEINIFEKEELEFYLEKNMEYASLNSELEFVPELLTRTSKNNFESDKEFFDLIVKQNDPTNPQLDGIIFHELFETYQTNKELFQEIISIENNLQNTSYEFFEGLSEVAEKLIRNKNPQTNKILKEIKQSHNVNNYLTEQTVLFISKDLPFCSPKKLNNKQYLDILLDSIIHTKYIKNISPLKDFINIENEKKNLFNEHVENNFQALDSRYNLINNLIEAFNTFSIGFLKIYESLLSKAYKYFPNSFEELFFEDLELKKIHLNNRVEQKILENTFNKYKLLSISETCNSSCIPVDIFDHLDKIDFITEISKLTPTLKKTKEKLLEQVYYKENPIIPEKIKKYLFLKTNSKLKAQTYFFKKKEFPKPMELYATIKKTIFQKSNELNEFIDSEDIKILHNNIFKSRIKNYKTVNLAISKKNKISSRHKEDIIDKINAVLKKNTDNNHLITLLNRAKERHIQSHSTIKITIEENKIDEYLSDIESCIKFLGKYQLEGESFFSNSFSNIINLYIINSLEEGQFINFAQIPITEIETNKNSKIIYIAGIFDNNSWLPPGWVNHTMSALENIVSENNLDGIFYDLNPRNTSFISNYFAYKLSLELGLKQDVDFTYELTDISTTGRKSHRKEMLFTLLHDNWTHAYFKRDPEIKTPFFLESVMQEPRNKPFGEKPDLVDTEGWIKGVYVPKK